MINIKKILNNYYINLIETYTIDCSNPKEEKFIPLEIQFKINNNYDETNIKFPYKIEKNSTLTTYLKNLKTNSEYKIKDITGGRNQRYKIYLKNQKNPLIIRTKDKNLKKSLDLLLEIKNN